MSIGDKIRERRLELGISQEELAHRTGYKSRSSINKIELGLRDINQGQIIDFARALSTTPAYLMEWENIQRSDMRNNDMYFTILTSEVYQWDELLGTILENACALNEDGQLEVLRYIDYLEKDPRYKNNQEENS